MLEDWGGGDFRGRTLKGTRVLPAPCSETGAMATGREESSASPQSPMQPSRTPRPGLQRSWGPLRTEGRRGTDVCLLLGVVLGSFLPVCQVLPPRLVRTRDLRRLDLTGQGCGVFRGHWRKDGVQAGKGRGLRRQPGSDEPPSKQCPPWLSCPPFP